MGRLFFFLEKPVRLFPSNSHDCYICVANFLAVMLVTLGQGYVATKVFTILTRSIKYWESLIQSLQNLVVIPPLPTPGHASHQGNLGRIGLETFLTKVFPIFFFTPPPPKKKKKNKKNKTKKPPPYCWSYHRNGWDDWHETTRKCMKWMQGWLWPRTSPITLTLIF